MLGIRELVEGVFWIVWDQWLADKSWALHLPTALRLAFQPATAWGVAHLSLTAQD